MFIVDQLKKGDPPLRILAGIILVGLAILLTGLFYVQVIQGRRYRASQVSQSFRTVRLPAVRGSIVDRHQRALARNRPNYRVHVYLEELSPIFQETYAARVGGARLSRTERARVGAINRYEVVSNMVARTGAALGLPCSLEPREFQEHYSDRLSLPMTVIDDLPSEQVARFVESVPGLPGFELEVQPLRHYPYGPLAAHVLGYLRRSDRPDDEDLFTRYTLPDYEGVVGIEGVFDGSLRGQPGVKSLLVNYLGYRQSENIWVEASPGDTVVLTLDLELQQAAEEALLSAGPDTRGAAVIMDVETGDLLAVASVPSFDPNDFLPAIGSDTWEAYQDPGRLPMISRATYGTYPPGSIFKMIVGLAALEAGILDPHAHFKSPGYYQLGRRRIGDTANSGQPATFDFEQALAQSSNTYFIHYGLLAGLDAIVAIGQQLHLGERTGLPIAHESAGILPTPAWREHERGGRWQVGETANLCIGQGYITVTPVQMAVMTAAIANGGRVLWPRLVARIEPGDPARTHEVISFPASRVRERLGVSSRNLRTVRDAMLADVEQPRGTGRGAFVEGMDICGKTGTAQVPRGSTMDHITWFVSFAPHAHPRYAVVVMIESGVSGGLSCAPLARRIYEVLKRQPPSDAEQAHLAAVH